MAAKTANVFAHVDPDMKVEAEAIMAQLGVSASMVIHMLYKQIIETKCIPFPLSVSNAFPTLDEEKVDLMMQMELTDAKTGKSRSAKSVFHDLRQKRNE